MTTHTKEKKTDLINDDTRATTVDDRLSRCVVAKRLRATADRCSGGEMKAAAAAAAAASQRVTSKHTSLPALGVRYHYASLASTEAPAAGPASSNLSVPTAV